LSQKHKQSDIVIEPVLEVPPAPDMPASGAGTLFTADSVATTISKVAALESFMNLITRDHGFEDFMREVLLVFMKIIKSEAGSILELDHDNQHYFFRTSAGISSDKLGKFTIPAGKGVVGHVGESRTVLVVDKADENKQHLKTIGQAVGFDARNLVAVPLMVRGKLYGVLELLNRVGELQYTPADVELLNYISEAASKAIEVRLMLGWALQHQSKDSNRGSAA
jgi:transcriptional regulator with GAF, ATPase, and Fis domain